MDGSAVVIPSAKPPAGLARENALFRIVYYGEALRAMTEHVSDSLISGQCAPMIEMLDDSFDTLSDKRDSFGPEEFTLFVMSKMLGMCDDAAEARQFQVGAAQYILKSADALPGTYKPVIDDAREMLKRSELSRDSDDALQDKPDSPEPEMPEPQMPSTAAPALAAPDAAKSTTSHAAIAAPRTPYASRATAGRTMPEGASATKVMRTRRSPSRRQVHRGLRSFATFLERSILAALVAFVIGVMVMIAMGYLDSDAWTQPTSSAWAPDRP
jgi:hypothetical protein